MSAAFQKVQEQTGYVFMLITGALPFLLSDAMEIIINLLPIDLHDRFEESGYAMTLNSVF